MGCDIHLYFEKKNNEGKWEKIQIDERLIPDDRIYSIFGFLAGIRCHEFEPQFEGRGIPNDTSMSPDCMGDGGKDDFWIGDYGFTYAYMDEILNAPWKENGLEQFYFYNFFKYVLTRIINSYGFINNEQQRKIRVIIGFDN